MMSKPRSSPPTLVLREISVLHSGSHPAATVYTANYVPLLLCPRLSCCFCKAKGSLDKIWVCHARSGT